MSLPPPGYPSWQDAQGAVTPLDPSRGSGLLGDILTAGLSGPQFGQGPTGFYGQPGYAPAPSPGYFGYSTAPYQVPPYPSGQQGFAGLGALGQPSIMLEPALAALGGAAVGALVDHEVEKHHHHS